MLGINAFAFVFSLPGVILIHFLLHVALYFIYHIRDKTNRTILNAKLLSVSLKIRTV